MFPAGHWGEIRFDAPSETLRPESFWPIERIMAEPPPRDAEAWHAAVWRETLGEHLRSDVSTGVFLSAGLDSTAILEAMTPGEREGVTAFTLAGELTSSDEGELAALTAANLGVRHEIVRLGAREAHAWVRDALGAMDQPTADGVNTYLISRASRAANFTVALGGAGADELHGAYGRAQSLPRLARLMRAAGPFAGMLRRGGVLAYQHLRGATAAERLDLLLAQAPVPWRMTQERRRYFTPSQIRALWPAGAGHASAWKIPSDLPAEYARLDPFNAVTLAELKGYLRDMLLRDADWATMANRQELRVPFLGRKYVECALRLPPALRRPSALSAKPLIAAGISPANRELLKRPKTGFTLAYGQMLLGPFRDELHLAARTLRDRLGFAFDAEDALRRLEQTRSAPEAFRAWSLLSLGTCIHRHAADT
jgi:asparagine synthase (glutamine-hydrolysing)